MNHWHITFLKLRQVKRWDAVLEEKDLWKKVNFTRVITLVHCTKAPSNPANRRCR
jgi:hypothetical protein